MSFKRWENLTVFKLKRVGYPFASTPADHPTTLHTRAHTDRTHYNNFTKAVKVVELLYSDSVLVVSLIINVHTVNY